MSTSTWVKSIKCLACAAPVPPGAVRCTFCGTQVTLAPLAAGSASSGRRSMPVGGLAAGLPAWLSVSEVSAVPEATESPTAAGADQTLLTLITADDLPGWLRSLPDTAAPQIAAVPVAESETKERRIPRVFGSADRVESASGESSAAPVSAELVGFLVLLLIVGLVALLIWQSLD